MIGKSQLLANKELCAWWVSVAHDPRFEAVMVCVHADLGTEFASNWDELKGANKAIAMLKTYTDNEEEGRWVPNPGLIHRMPSNLPPKNEEEKKA